MMNRIFTVLTIFLMVACSESPDQQAQPTDKGDFIAEIERTQKLVEQAKPEQQAGHAKRLLNLYLDYAKAYPADSLAPEMIFSAANVCIGLEEYERSIRLFDRTADRYKSYLKRPEAIYLAGFVYDDKLNNYGKAKTYYERVISTYPDHIFANDAKSALELLGKSEVEILRMFEAKNSAADQE